MPHENLRIVIRCLVWYGLHLSTQPPIDEHPVNCLPHAKNAVLLLITTVLLIKTSGHRNQWSNAMHEELTAEFLISGALLFV